MSERAGSARPPKNHRRAEARERTRQAMAIAKRRERRQRLAFRSGIAAGVVAVLAVVALVVMSSIKPAGPGPRNMASDGIVVGKGFDAVRTAAVPAGDKPVPTKTQNSGTTADIRLYTDFQCPGCASFENENGAYIEDLVKSGAATAEYHPVAILDRFSQGTKYSTRSTAAAACVADVAPDSYFAFNKVLFERQPGENTAGLSDDLLKSIATSAAGQKNKAKIDACIDGKRFTSWATAATQRALAGPLPGVDVTKLKATPAVFVDGKQFDASKQTFKEFVASALGAAAHEKSSTDTKPADTKPTDTKPADTKPADTKPADTKP